MSGVEVRLDRVEFSYGETAMQFDLAVEASDIVAVMGPSGSGKTTLLNLVAGFERPMAGRVLIGGADMTRLAPAARPVSMVFQENNLFAHLDVEQNVGLGRSPALKLTAADRADVAAAFQAAVIDVLVAKVMRAVEQKQCPRVVLGGGVAASRALRAALQQALGDGGELYAPSPRLATDNAAMIARAALFRYERGDVSPLETTARADLPFPGLARAPRFRRPAGMH